MVREGLGKSIVDMERNRMGGPPPPMNQPNHPQHQQQHQSPHMYRPGAVPTNAPSGDPIRYDNSTDSTRNHPRNMSLMNYYHANSR